MANQLALKKCILELTCIEINKKSKQMELTKNKNFNTLLYLIWLEINE